MTIKIERVKESQIKTHTKRQTTIFINNLYIYTYKDVFKNYWFGIKNDFSLYIHIYVCEKWKIVFIPNQQFACLIYVSTPLVMKTLT